MSRPELSVPSQCWADEPWYCSPGRQVTGSCGLRSPTSPARAAKSRTRIRPAIAARWRTRILSFRPSIADPRIDECVEEIDEQVYDHEREGEDEHCAADRFVLRLAHRRQDIGAHPVPVEDRLGK